MKPLLVGESNPYSSGPSDALLPWPVGSAGWRLCHKVLGLEEREYLERFGRVNLCARRWDLSRARDRAAELESVSGRVFVLLGRRVLTAFRIHAGGASTFSWCRSLGNTFVFLPHPSGLSRAWNTAGAYERARETLRAAGVAC